MTYDRLLPVLWSNTCCGINILRIFLEFERIDPEQTGTYAPWVGGLGAKVKQVAGFREYQ